MSPKRLAPDIDAQMITATLELGAREGIGKITTLKVAKACSVAEPTVYRHFESKKNLMLQAFLQLEKEIGVALKGEIFDTRDLKGSTRKYMDKIFDCLVAHPDETVYYNSYRHSAYFTQDSEAGENIHKSIFRQMVEENKKLKKFEEFGFPVMWTFVVENLMNLAEKVVTNKLEDSKKLRDTLFMLVFSVMFDK